MGFWPTQAFISVHKFVDWRIRSVAVRKTSLKETSDQMLALEPQQRLTHRLTAHRVTFRQLLLPHIIAGY